MHQVLIPAFPAVTIGIIVFFVGAFLTRRVAFLRNYSIPEPVSGGLAAALVTWALFSWTNVEIQFDLALSRPEVLGNGIRTHQHGGSVFKASPQSSSVTAFT